MGRETYAVTVDRLADYPERIDARTPSEFAEDHIPDAQNCPVLNDEERERVGTVYKRESAFSAKKMGAALVARNIATMLEDQFVNHARAWRPLVYCWRGGKRSSALTHVLNQVGWQARQLEGGYRAYRRFVVGQLETLPYEFSYQVVCGLTGSGKSKLLQSLAAGGAQVLDLEELARHRGSLLGDVPRCEQPSQKCFESDIVRTLSRFDRAQPVFVESESKRIGRLRVPDALIARMWESECIWLDVAMAARVSLLKDEYAHFVDAPEILSERLRPLAAHLGRKKLATWDALAAKGDWDSLVVQLLQEHYDPTYLRSIKRHYRRLQQARSVSVSSWSSDSLDAFSKGLRLVIS